MSFNLICRRISIHARPHIKLELRSPFTTLHSDSSNQGSFTVTYLINSCGLSPESAISASKYLDLSKSPSTADSVLDFLTTQRFTKAQVSLLIRRHPKILLSDPEKMLLPTFQTLKSTGLSNTVLVEIVTARPKGMLCKALQSRALPGVTYLKSVLESDDKVINAIKRFPLALTYDLQVYAAENIQILLELGVPNYNIVNLLALQPRTLITSADRFRKVVEEVKKMGFDPSKTRFLWAIHALRAMSKSTWDTKVELYKKWGWSEDEIFLAFERYPGCMMAATDKITRVLDFVVNTMGWEKSYIIERPIVICFSVEKRIIPRCLVYQHLAEKGLMEESFCFNKWLMYSDKKFLKWIQKKYEDEAPELLQLYQKHLDEANRSKPSLLRKKDVV